MIQVAGRAWFCVGKYKNTRKRGMQQMLPTMLQMFHGYISCRKCNAAEFFLIFAGRCDEWRT